MAEHVLQGGDSTKLFNLLKGAVHSWGRIADKLNFTFEDKTTITHTPALNGDEDYFQALLHQWLKREHHLTTVEVLANALRSAGEHRLAYELEHNPELMSPDREISSKMATGKQQSSGDTHGVEGANATDHGSSTGEAGANATDRGSSTGGVNGSELQQPSTSSGGVDDTDSPSAGAATASAADSEAPPVIKEQFPSRRDIDFPEVDELQTEEILKSVGVLLMVVNDLEYRAVLGLMNQKTGVKITRSGVTFMIGTYGKYRTAVVQTSQGILGYDAAVLKTVRAVEVLKPSVVISVGVAYGKSKETQRLGDVLVSNLIHNYIYKREGKKRVMQGPQYSVGGKLLNIFKNFDGWDKEGNSSVLVGPLASGPDLIDNLQIKEEILGAFPDAIGGEMEAAGIMSVIIDSPCKMIVIKAICDWADGTKNDKWQPFAAHTAADYVLHHMKSEAFADVVG